MSDIREQVRNSLDYQKRINFDHIIEDPAYKDKYRFMVKNEDELAPAEHIGWRKWPSVGLGLNSVDEPDGVSGIDDNSISTSGGYAMVPVGVGKYGRPTNAFLMYIEKEKYDMIMAVHQEEADAQLAAAGGRAQSDAGSKLKTNHEAVHGYVSQNLEITRNNPDPTDVKLGNS